MRRRRRRNRWAWLFPVALLSALVALLLPFLEEGWRLWPLLPLLYRGLLILMAVSWLFFLQGWTAHWGVAALAAGSWSLLLYLLVLRPPPPSQPDGWRAWGLWILLTFTLALAQWALFLLLWRLLWGGRQRYALQPDWPWLLTLWPALAVPGVILLFRLSNQVQPIWIPALLYGAILVLAMVATVQSQA